SITAISHPYRRPCASTNPRIFSAKCGLKDSVILARRSVTANWTEEFCSIDAALPIVDLNKSVTPTMKPTTNFQPKELLVMQAAIPPSDYRAPSHGITFRSTLNRLTL